MPPIVVLDTCVLVPARQRDVLLELACAGAYQALWSNQIEAELARTITTLRQNRKALPAQTQAYIKRLLAAMNRALPDARLVLDANQAPIENVLPDPNDMHILQAAIQGSADLIVTNNLKDFPPGRLPQTLAVKTPDDFLCSLLRLKPETVLESIQAVSDRTGSKGPHLDAPQIIETLAVFTPNFAKVLSAYYPTAE